METSTLPNLSSIPARIGGSCGAGLMSPTPPTTTWRRAGLVFRCFLLLLELFIFGYCVCFDSQTQVCFVFQLIPRTIELDPSGKQLIQWPVQELEALRGKHVELSNVELPKGEQIEIKDITAAQVCVCVCFVFIIYGGR